MDSDLSDFGRGLASLHLRETDMALGLLWFLDRRGEQETSVKRLAELIYDLSLKGRVNVSRLGTRLAARKAVVRGKTAGTFRLRLAQKPALDERFGPLTTPLPPKVESHIIDGSLVAGTRGYLVAIVNEI